MTNPLEHIPHHHLDLVQFPWLPPGPAGNGAIPRLAAAGLGADLHRSTAYPA